MPAQIISVLAIGLFGYYLHNIGLEYMSSHFIVCMISCIALSAISQIGGYMKRVEYETGAIQQLATIAAHKLTELTQIEAAKKTTVGQSVKDFTI